MKDIPIWVRWNGQELVRMIAEDKPGWFTYRIRKKRPLGARFAAYRFTRRLPGLIRSAGRKLAFIMRDGIGHGVQPPSGLGRRKR